DVLGAFGGEVDGEVGPARVHGRLEGLAEAGGVLPREGERVVGAGGGEFALALEHLPDDADVLARAGEGLGEGLPVPAFDDLRSGDAEPEDGAAFGEVVEG